MGLSAIFRDIARILSFDTLDPGLNDLAKERAQSRERSRSGLQGHQRFTGNGRSINSVSDGPVSRDSLLSGPPPQSPRYLGLLAWRRPDGGVQITLDQERSIGSCREVPPNKVHRLPLHADLPGFDRVCQIIFVDDRASIINDAHPITHFCYTLALMTPLVSSVSGTCSVMISASLKTSSSEPTRIPICFACSSDRKGSYSDNMHAKNPWLGLIQQIQSSPIRLPRGSC